ncbi:MAG TPA: hypothetical protein VN875_06955 [Candidatus Binatus sp.]|jgi:hypothetical protein|nr:hypothetical protein [Candidatus Binatus sp.]
MLTANGTPQNAVINQPFALQLQAKVVKGASNPVSGAMVTFTAPATGSSEHVHDERNGYGNGYDQREQRGHLLGVHSERDDRGPYTVTAAAPGALSKAEKQ